jgi:hypothetical protein
MRFLITFWLVFVVLCKHNHDDDVVVVEEFEMEDVLVHEVELGQIGDDDENKYIPVDLTEDVIIPITLPTPPPEQAPEPTHPDGPSPSPIPSREEIDALNQKLREKEEEIARLKIEAELERE